MDLSIFDAFPNAIISGIWEIGSFQHGTVIGNQFTPIRDLNVVVDEGNSSVVNTTPESLNSDILIYAYPCQLPTADTNKLVSGYMIHNKETDSYYEIIDAGLGKNQHTGYLEHIELKLLQTEVTNGE